MALVDEVDDDTANRIRNETPPSHWNGAELPCAYQASTNTLLHFERTPMWGALFWSTRRRIVKDLLEP